MMEDNNKKLDFNFDFLGKDINPMEAQNNRILKIIDKIKEIKKIAKTVSSEQIDILIEDISITSEKLSNNNLYDGIFIAIIDLIKELNKYKKYNKSMQLLKYIYNIPKSEEHQKKCKEYMDNINKILSYKDVKIMQILDENLSILRTSDDSLLKSTLIIVLIVFLIICVGIKFNDYKIEQRNIHTKQQQIQLLQERTFYLYENLQGRNLSNNEKYQYQNEFNQNIKELVSKSEQNENDIKQELKKKYVSNKNGVIANLATAYVNDEIEFDNIKKKALPKYFHNNEIEMNKAVDDYLGYRLLQLKPQVLPKSGLIRNYTGQNLVATFKIVNETSCNYYIKMYNSKNNKLALTIFIRANSIVEIKVPLGQYIVKSINGVTWYGFNDLFGRDAIYETAEKIFKFYKDGNYIVGIEYHVQKTPYGNVNSQEITANEF